MGSVRQPRWGSQLVGSSKVLWYKGGTGISETHSSTARTLRSTLVPRDTITPSCDWGSCLFCLAAIPPGPVLSPFSNSPSHRSHLIYYTLPGYHHVCGQGSGRLFIPIRASAAGSPVVAETGAWNGLKHLRQCDFSQDRAAHFSTCQIRWALVVELVPGPLQPVDGREECTLGSARPIFRRYWNWLESFGQHQPHTPRALGNLSWLAIYIMADRASDAFKCIAWTPTKWRRNALHTPMLWVAVPRLSLFILG